MSESAKFIKLIMLLPWKQCCCNSITSEQASPLLYFYFSSDKLGNLNAEQNGVSDDRLSTVAAFFFPFFPPKSSHTAFRDAYRTENTHTHTSSLSSPAELLSVLIRNFHIRVVVFEFSFQAVAVLKVLLRPECWWSSAFPLAPLDPSLGFLRAPRSHTSWARTKASWHTCLSQTPCGRRGSPETWGCPALPCSDLISVIGSGGSREGFDVLVVYGDPQICNSTNIFGKTTHLQRTHGLRCFWWEPTQNWSGSSRTSSDEDLMVSPGSAVSCTSLQRSNQSD